MQKIKRLKRNMVCKYKFVLMNQSLFQFFYKRRLSDSIFIELDLNKRSSWLRLEDGLNGLHNRSLTFSLLEIYCSSSSSSPLNVLQVLQRFFKFFKDSWSRISLELGLLENLIPQNERGCPLFIVVSKDKFHFELICLKSCSGLMIGPNSS